MPPAASLPARGAAAPLLFLLLLGLTPAPAAPPAGKPAVLLFVAADCPVSNAYAPEIRRLCARYGAAVSFTLVYADPSQSLAGARRHARLYGLPCPVVVDPAHRLTRRAGATVTPEAAVFAPGGRLVYRGRIDDRFVGYGRQRDRPAVHDLRLALDAVLHGRAAPRPSGPPVGCFSPED